MEYTACDNPLPRLSLVSAALTPELGKAILSMIGKMTSFSLDMGTLGYTWYTEVIIHTACRACSLWLRRVSDTINPGEDSTDEASAHPPYKNCF